ncbi:MAG: hypothetical protein U0133_18015 [Gemmatimonadales bacterium]
MRGILKALTVMAALVTVTTAAAAPVKTFTSKPFAGVKANTGTVTATVDMGKITLKVSDDFVIPDTPAPSWQIIDSKGNTYLLNQFRIKGDKTNRQITLPAYIKDVAKVQVWCSFAEVVLGETSFDTIVK